MCCGQLLDVFVSRIESAIIASRVLEWLPIHDLWNKRVSFKDHTTIWIKALSYFGSAQQDLEFFGRVPPEERAVEHDA